jgi:hypothetical protein
VPGPSVLQTFTASSWLVHVGAIGERQRPTPAKPASAATEGTTTSLGSGHPSRSGNELVRADRRKVIAIAPEARPDFLGESGGERIRTSVG